MNTRVQVDSIEAMVGYSSRKDEAKPATVLRVLLDGEPISFFSNEAGAQDYAAGLSFGLDVLTRSGQPKSS